LHVGESFKRYDVNIVANCPAFGRAPYFAPLYALPWDACPSFSREPLFNLLTENIHLKIGFSSGNL